MRLRFLTVGPQEPRKRLLQWKGAKEKNATDRSALRYLVAVDDDIQFSFLHYFVGRCDSNRLNKTSSRGQ